MRDARKLVLVWFRKLKFHDRFLPPEGSDVSLRCHAQ